MKIEIDSINDAHSVTSSDASRVVRDLCISYTSIRRTFLVTYNDIHEAFEDGNITRIAKLMESVFGLPSGFVKKVGFSATISGGKFDTALAGMLFSHRHPDNLPLDGTLLFKDSKEVVCRYSEALVLHTIAHEYSHARLRLDGHLLRNSEFATDILAIIATGTTERYLENIHKSGTTVGYIREALFEVVFTALAKHADTIYLPAV